MSRAQPLVWVFPILQIVDDKELAQRVAQKLMTLTGTRAQPLYHAVDTETAYFDVTKQTPVGCVDYLPTSNVSVHVGWSSWWGPKPLSHKW